MVPVIKNKNIFRYMVLLLFAATTGALYAQDSSSTDGLLAEARKAAFDKNNYPLAKSYLYKALQRSPDYADIQIFLGRIHTWTKNYDSARYYFNSVLNKRKDYEDLYIAYADMEFFDDNYQRALYLVREGLQAIPSSEALMFREAKLLNQQKKYIEAERSLQKLLLLQKNSQNNDDAKALLATIQENRNKPDSTVEIPHPVAVNNEDSLSADGLLVMARTAAFDEKNYALAKSRLWRALAISPSYADIKIFLGRIYSWTKQYDSARYYLHAVLKDKPDYTDASFALADVEYWNDQYMAAMDVLNEAIKYHPESEGLWIKKARVLISEKKYAAAQTAIDEALRKNHNSAEARSLANRIRDLSSLNKIGLSYDLVSFDKQFPDPWHLVSLDYTRTTGIGSVTGRVNYANRFTQNGVQYELEAYPHISNTFYSYVDIGYSANVGVFPHWRGGLSLYANLPASFEGELGVRYLKFSGDPTWIYTAYLGKYYKSWLFGFRTYLTPGIYTSTVSSSYTVSARYYYGGADDLVGFSFGYGISPDDRENLVLLNGAAKLTSYKAGINFRKKVSARNVVSFDAGWLNQEYLPQTKGNQYQISVGWVFRF